ncbi:hypothetical protein BJF93_00930 [Xaviernesmea oryzae]|uniref:Uncharacterized protein n=1 Tax=Xaviernesmea oryzae TaxID=464029 RepID=A0A1Q9B0M4_9HYPH|nr:hypothetical protein [Xaviernesmea oryzae]OLP61525.1 hypothetical protein BJF93_00930 [Xaviernesmea oryzae]SEL66417.1 hypothetical protein SAMN04487976_1112 [Xaviernesmea oryzae]
MDQEVKIFGLAGLLATLAIALVAYLSYAPRVNHQEASPLLYQLAERQANRTGMSETELR